MTEDLLQVTFHCFVWGEEKFEVWVLVVGTGGLEREGVGVAVSWALLCRIRGWLKRGWSSHVRMNCKWMGDIAILF